MEFLYARLFILYFCEKFIVYFLIYLLNEANHAYDTTLHMLHDENNRTEKISIRDVSGLKKKNLSMRVRLVWGQIDVKHCRIFPRAFTGGSLDLNNSLVLTSQVMIPP